jgi:transposase
LCNPDFVAWEVEAAAGLLVARRNHGLVRNGQRLTTRLGKKPALVAVGHSILIIAYHLLSKRASYQELGGDYFDRQNAQLYQSKIVHKLEAFGLKVTLEPVTT